MSRLVDRVKRALEINKNIAVDISELGTARGFTQNEMAELGLSKVDLKKLERKGLAARGYTKNTWGAGETLPSGKEVPLGSHFNGKGHHPMWILVGKGLPKEVTDGQA